MGVVIEVPNIFRAPVYGAHCAVIFAIAQLSCLLKEIHRCVWLRCVFQRNRRTSRSDLNDVQHAGRNPLIVVSTVPDPTDINSHDLGHLDTQEVPGGDHHATSWTLTSPPDLAVHRTSSASASTDVSDVRLDLSPRATSSRCDDHDDDDGRRMSSTVFTFDINVDEQSDYDV